MLPGWSSSRARLEMPFYHWCLHPPRQLPFTSVQKYSLSSIQIKWHFYCCVTQAWIFLCAIVSTCRISNNTVITLLKKKEHDLLLLHCSILPFQFFIPMTLFLAFPVKTEKVNTFHIQVWLVHQHTKCKKSQQYNA